MGHSSALRVHSVSRGGVTYVRLNGTVDESFDPQALLAEARGQKVILNLKGVTRLSSFGVREWTHAMRELCARVEHVYLVEVSPAVVTQLNMVANFAGAAHVLSVQAPFYCDCGYESEITYDLRDGEVNLGSVVCRECASLMSFDDDPESYFQYPLENARSQPIDPNIDVFLRHLSDSFQEDGGGMRSFPPPESASNVRTSEIPIPSIVPHGTNPGLPIPTRVTSVGTMGGGTTGTGSFARSQDLSMTQQHPRPPPLWVSARSVLLGLSIPVVLAILVLILWPAGGSGSGLPDEAKQEFKEHFSQGRWGEAALLVRRLERQKKISPEAAERVKEEIKAAALAPYNEHLENQRYAEAAQLVTQAARDRVIAPRDSTRLHKEVMERAIARHRELLAAQQISSAEALAEALTQRDVLPAALRRSFQNDLTLDRQQLSEKLERKAREAFETEHWEEANAAMDVMLRLGPPEPDIMFLKAEALRKLEKMNEAAALYETFIGMVQHDDPPHTNFDGALYYRAKYLADSGKTREANELFKRVTEIPNSRFHDNAAKALQHESN